MIVIAIIAILVAAITPQFTAYYARGRDTQRLSDIKAMSSKFQDYNRIYGTYPSNTDTLGTTTSYCISDIRNWTDALPQIRDKQFTQLGGMGMLHNDAKSANPSIGSCLTPGSYFYAQLQKETSYGVLAARMERQTTGANYNDPVKLRQNAYIDEMVTARPLDKNIEDVDKIYLIITN
jgi:type II secretory pathway pseudopilin PulG